MHVKFEIKNAYICRTLYAITFLDSFNILLQLKPYKDIKILIFV